ncbi:MAG: GDP-mannose 4,6-dehydratase, partial [Ilumatobacteraceae bacterium]
MKYFVTGAAGFIGSNYVRWLLANTDHTVTVFDKLTYAGNLESINGLVDAPDGRCSFVQGDICDRDAVEAVLPGHDIIVHFAAESHVDRSIEDPYAFV